MNIHKNERLTPRGREILVSRLHRQETPTGVARSMGVSARTVYKWCRRIDAYDLRRADFQPYARQRHAEEYGTTTPYGWSEDKARQYSKPQRADFGAFIRRKGFRLD